MKNTDLLPHWIGLIKIYRSYVWLASFITCACVCIVIWLMAKIAIEEFTAYTRIGDIFLTICRIMLGNIPPRLPRTNLIRFVVLLWTIFCMNWNSAYTSSLISMITQPLRMNAVIES